jgi:hypothetical protein
MTDLKKYLPSRPLQIAIVVLIIGGALIAWGDDAWQYAQRLRTLGSSLPEPIRTTTPEALTLRDGDGDGVEDWEEVLLGLNPNVRDTNGDGIGDNQERTQRRILLGDERITELEQLSEGDKIGLQLVARIKQNGEVPFSLLTGEELQSYTQMEASNLKQYSRLDLTIDRSQEIEAQRLYASRLETILNSGDMIKDSDLETIGTFFGNLGSPSFRASISRAESMTQNLLTIPVPLSAVPLHLELLNNYYAFLQLLSSIETSESDPVRTHITFSLIQGSIEGIFQSIRSFDGYFFVALNEKMY